MRTRSMCDQWARTFGGLADPGYADSRGSSCASASGASSEHVLAYREIAIRRRYRVFAISCFYRKITIMGASEMSRARMRAPADFGLAIQQARLAGGMTQTDLAAAVGVPQSTVSDVESGKSTIYMRRLLDMMRATGVELTATWEDERDAARG
ncbi:helix-turn-helix transcriptional regulator [Nocardioides sp. CCNWLW239]|uniref:helix-turn-helix domain-containing protein n=1 Tax=Nocardioides sp. CCNWLW239 TaxID=3128902 RepID=UPI00301A1C30